MSSSLKDTGIASPAKLRVCFCRQAKLNKVASVRRRSKSNKTFISLTEVTTMLSYNDIISNFIPKWAIGNIPDKLWLLSRMMGER